jgi:hypothetical protein
MLSMKGISSSAWTRTTGQAVIFGQDGAFDRWVEGFQVLQRSSGCNSVAHYGAASSG